MTEKELRRLRRTELLELLLELRKDLDAVKAENNTLRQRLETEQEQRELLTHILKRTEETAALVKTLQGKHQAASHSEQGEA